MALYYFAYGANMDLADLTHRFNRRRRTGVRFRSSVPARLKGFRVAFNMFAPERRSGILNLIPDARGEVFGVLHELVPGDSLCARDLAEGKPGACRIHTVTVRSTHGREVAAATLRAEVKGQKIFVPSDEYLDLVVAAAQHYKLPTAWIDHLRSLQKTAVSQTGPRRVTSPCNEK